MISSLQHSFTHAPFSYSPAPSSSQSAPLTELLDRLKEGVPLSLNQQKQALHLLELLDRSANRGQPSELNGRSITLRDEKGMVHFTWFPEAPDSSTGGIAIQAQGDGLFHGIDEAELQTTPGSFLHALLSALRGAHAYTRLADVEDLAQRMSDFAHSHSNEIQHLFESSELFTPEQEAVASETCGSGNIQENMLRNVLMRTASQVATRMAAQLLDHVIEGTVLEGIRFDELAQLKPALEQFRSSERSLTQRLQSLADALGRVAKIPGDVAAGAQQCLELCLKTIRLAEMIDRDGLSLDVAQKALVQLADALDHPLLKAWSEISGARSALVRTSQWLGELTPLFGHVVTLESFLGSLGDSPTLREMLSAQYQGVVETFDELGALFGALRERRTQAPAASPLNQATWFLDLMDSGRLEPLVSAHLSDTCATLVDGLQSARQTLDALHHFPIERSPRQQLQWLAERLSRTDAETVLPRALLDALRKTAQSLAGIASVREEIGPIPFDAPLREQLTWLVKGLNHLEINGLIAAVIGRDNGFAMLSVLAGQAKGLGQWLAHFPGTENPIAALRWICELSREGSAMALLDEWLPADTRQALAAWVEPFEHALHLAPQLELYPAQGNWWDKLSWGAQLLIAPEAPALLRKILPEPFASLLVKPFEALRHTGDIPIDATPLAQWEWATRLLGSPENRALLRRYAPAGYDQWLAQLGNLSALSQNAATLQRTLASDSAWPSKIKDLAQLLMQPLAEELKRHPELLLRTASWASGGNKTTVGAALTALRLYTTMPEGLSNTKKASWIFKTALREALHEYSATLSLAVNHGDKFHILLTYARQTRDLYRAWADPRRMERELGNLVELLKRDLPLPENLRPLLDALPALPALLHAHEQYRPDMPWYDRLEHIGGQLSRSDSAALKRLLDSLEAYVVSALVECASQTMQVVRDYEFYDPLKFPGADGATLPPRDIDTGASYLQTLETSPAKSGIATTASLPEEATDRDAPSPSSTTPYAMAMAGGGALGLFGSLALLGYALYQRTHEKEETQPFLSSELQRIRALTNSTSRSAEREDLIAADPEPSHFPPKRTGMLQRTPALVMLGVLAAAFGSLMAKGIYDLKFATDETEAKSLVPVDELNGLELIDALDTLDEDTHALLADAKHDELQIVLGDIDRALAVLADIEGALGVTLDNLEGNTTSAPTVDPARSRPKRGIGDEDNRSIRHDIQTQRASLNNAKVKLQKNLNALGALAQAKQNLSRLRRDVENLQPKTPQTGDLSSAQTRKAGQVIQALNRLLKTPELPPNPIDFLVIQLTALATKHDCLDKVDGNTTVNVEYVQQRAQYGQSMMIASERRSVQAFKLIDILRREHLRFLKKHNQNPGYEKISFDDRRLPAALLDEVCACDVEAQYTSLNESFKGELEGNPERAEKRLEGIRQKVADRIEKILIRHPDLQGSEFLHECLIAEKASTIKLRIPGISATLKDAFFVDTQDGGGFLFFLNGHTYRIPGTDKPYKAYIKNHNLQNDIRQALPLYERLVLGEKRISYYYHPTPFHKLPPRLNSPLVFEETQNISHSLSEISFSHNAADMDTLTVSDSEISWDKWIAALDFFSTLLSIALPVTASMQKLASQAMLLGVFNSVQTLGLSIAPKAFKALYADLPEERAQALREATIGLVVEAGGWSLTGLGKLDAFNKFSEKVNQIVNRMSTKLKAEDFIQQLAHDWKYNRNKLLGDLDRMANAMPFKMESLPSPILNRLDKQLLKMTLASLLPRTDDDTDLNNLLDQIEQKRLQLLSNRGAIGYTLSTMDGEGHPAPAPTPMLNEKLQELTQRASSWLRSLNLDDLPETMNGIKIEFNTLDFKRHLKEEADSPTLQDTRKLLESLEQTLLDINLHVAQRPQSPQNNRAKIAFDYLYDAITEAIHLHLNEMDDNLSVSSPLNSELQQLLHMIPVSMKPGETLATLHDIEHHIFLLNFNSYFRKKSDSPSALETERLVSELEIRLRTLKQSIDHFVASLSSEDMENANTLYERAINHIRRKFPIDTLTERPSIPATETQPRPWLHDELEQLRKMIPSSPESEDFLKLMSYIEHRVALLDFNSHLEGDEHSSIQETNSLVDRLLVALRNLKAEVNKLELTHNNLKKIRGFYILYQHSVSSISQKYHESRGTGTPETDPWATLTFNEKLEQLGRMLPATIQHDDFETRMFAIESRITQLHLIDYIPEEDDSESVEESRRLVNLFLTALQTLRKEIDSLRMDYSNIAKVMSFYSCYHTSMSLLDNYGPTIAPLGATTPSTNTPPAISLNAKLTQLANMLPPSINQDDFTNIIAEIGYRIAKLDYSSYFKETPNSASAMETRRLVQNLLASLQSLKQHIDQAEIQPSSIIKTIEFDYFYEASKNNINLGFYSKINDAG